MHSWNGAVYLVEEIPSEKKPQDRNGFDPKTGIIVSLGLRDGNGNVIYATEVVSAVLGDGLGVDNPAGWQDMILGPADQTPTAMGNGQASITVSFCPIEDTTEEPMPGFGVMGALVALGAAMLAGRRSFSEEDTDE